MTRQRKGLIFGAADFEHVAKGPFVGVEFLFLGVAQRNQVICLLSQLGSFAASDFAGSDGVGHASAAMAEFDVGDFVCDDELKFGVTAHELQNPLVDVNVAAEMRKGVDLRRRQHREGVIDPFAFRVCEQRLGEIAKPFDCGRRV